MANPVSWQLWMRQSNSGAYQNNRSDSTVPLVSLDSQWECNAALLQELSQNLMDYYLRAFNDMMIYIYIIYIYLFYYYYLFFWTFNHNIQTKCRVLKKQVKLTGLCHIKKMAYKCQKLDKTLLCQHTNIQLTDVSGRCLTSGLFKCVE